MSSDRPAYPSDVSDEEWALVAPYLALLREDSGQRDHELREVFNRLRYIVKTGAPWRFMPHDLPPWAATTSRPNAGFPPTALAQWRLLACCVAGSGGARAGAVCGDPGQPDPTLLARDRRAGGLRRGQAQARLEGAPGGDTPGMWWLCTSRGERGRPQPGWGADVCGASGDRRERGDGVRRSRLHGREAGEAADANGIALEVVKAPEAKRGFVLLPRRWGVGSARWPGRRAAAGWSRTTSAMPPRWQAST